LAEVLELGMEKRVKSSTTRRNRGSAAEKKKQPSKEASKDSVWEWIKSFGIALILFLVVRTFLIQAYTIPSGSMENSLLIGDYLMANNAIYGAQIPLTDWRIPAFREPQHGDIVVFRPEYNDPVIDVVKRVIGEPGDTIQMIDRVVYRNGERLEEPYVEPNYTPDQPLQRYGPAGYDWHFGALAGTVDPATYEPTRDNWGPLIVPPGKYMLLGDNRDESLDSRYMGFIDREVISGKAMFIYYSVNEEIERPFPRFLTAARWGRIGHIIR
jgi:signal peptidase I, bacterial type